MKETKNKTVLAMRLEGNEGRGGLLQTIGNGPDSKIGPTVQGLRNFAMRMSMRING